MILRPYLRIIFKLKKLDGLNFSQYYVSNFYVTCAAQLRQFLK